MGVSFKGNSLFNIYFMQVAFSILKLPLENLSKNENLIVHFAVGENTNRGDKFLLSILRLIDPGRKSSFGV
jgi:hypothetical protein